MRRLRDVLEHDDRFVLVGGSIPRWTLAATAVQEQYTGQEEKLIEFGRDVQGIKLVRWKTSSRHGPLADRESLAALCEHVMRSAGTALTVRQMTTVAAVRLNLAEPPAVAQLDDEVFHGSSRVSEDTVGSLVAIRASAEDIWAQLTDRERTLLPILDMGVREAAERIGIGKTQAAVSIQRLKALLKSIMEEDPEDGLSKLRELEIIASEERPRTDN